MLCFEHHPAAHAVADEYRLTPIEDGDEVVVPTPGGERTFEIVSLVTIHDED